MKPARELLKSGRVSEAKYEPPLLRGYVREGAKNYRSGLRIKSTIDVENLCSCWESRSSGKICAHSVAVGLGYLNPPAAAVAVPNADKQGALVVALTADGSVYLAGNRLSAPALADQLRTMFSTRSDKTLYIKADARVPYASLVEVIDAVWKSGIEGLTLLTAQRDASDQGSRPVPPKGLEMRVVQP